MFYPLTIHLLVGRLGFYCSADFKMSSVSSTRTSFYLEELISGSVWSNLFYLPTHFPQKDALSVKLYGYRMGAGRRKPGWEKGGTWVSYKCPCQELLGCRPGSCYYLPSTVKLDTYLQFSFPLLAISGGY